MKRELVKGKDFAGNDVSLYVTAPGHKDHLLAQLQYNMKVAELIREGKPSRELYRDPEFDFIQMGHIHKQGHGNKPHDHGPCWVVYGSYKGVTEITKYKRTDDGSQPGVARLEKERLDRLTPGVVVPYLPGDIHSTHAVEAPGVVFRFLSYDLDKVDRYRYSPEKNTVVKV